MTQQLPRAQVMANKIENGSEPQGRPPIRLLIFVLLLGTFLSWWGARDHRQLFGELPRQPVAAAVLPVPASIQIDDAMVARGFQIEERQCAGCHDMYARSTGPSYQEIVAFYRHQSPHQGGEPELSSRLASAIAHPQPGWGNFAPGPSESALSLDERIVVASWILSGVDQKKSAREGTGK